MIDGFLGRQWTKDYTCNDLAKEFWRELTGDELYTKNMINIEKPISPCIVFMSNSNRKDTHIGVYYKDKVIHLGYRGSQYVPLEYLEMSFKHVSFYK